MRSDDEEIRLEHGPYMDPMPTWEEILQQGYIKSMDYFHATFTMKPKSRSWGQSSLHIEAETLHTRVVVWTHAAKPLLIMACGEERTLVKALEGKDYKDESELQYLSLDIGWIVEDAERER